MRASARSSSSIQVQWRAPSSSGSGNVEDANIRGYAIRYRLHGYNSANWNERNVSNAQDRSILLEPLIAWREYEIQVGFKN